MESLGDVIREELNVKQLTPQDNLDDLVSYSYKPNLKTLGPKYGKLLGLLRKELPELPSETLAPLRNGKSVTLEIGGNEVTLGPDDVLVSTEQAADWVCADDSGVQIAVSTVLSDELLAEGMARDFVRHVQQARKDADLEIADRIAIRFTGANNHAAAAITQWAEFIQGETLADSLQSADSLEDGQSVKVGDSLVRIAIEKQ